MNTKNTDQLKQQVVLIKIHGDDAYFIDYWSSLVSLYTLGEPLFELYIGSV